MTALSTRGSSWCRASAQEILVVNGFHRCWRGIDAFRSTSAVFLIFSDFADLQRVNVPLTQMWLLYQLSSNTEHRIDLHRIWSNLALGT